MMWNRIIPQAETVAAIIKTFVLWAGLICVGIAGTLVWTVKRADFERGLVFRQSQSVERYTIK